MPHEFKIQNDIDSFFSFQKRVAIDNPEWSPEQVSRHALIVFNTGMFPKQVRSHFTELDGASEIDPDQSYDVVDGKLVHEHYGSFDRFIENATSPEERAILVLFQERMVHAAPGTQAVSFDVSQGIAAIRYADIGVKDDQGKVRLAKRIDITNGEGPMNLEDAWKSLHALSGVQEGRKVVTNGVPKVGLLVIPSTEQATIERTIAQVRDSAHRKTIPLRVQKDDPDQHLNRQAHEREMQKQTAVKGHVKRSVLSDRGNTIGGALIFFQDRLRRKEASNRIFALPVVEQIRRLFHGKDPVQKIGREEHREKKQTQQNRFERLTLIKIREKPVRVTETIQKHQSEMKQSLTALVMVAETGVAVGAVSLLLSFLAKELPKPVKAVEKSISRHKRKEMKRLQKTERRQKKERHSGKKNALLLAHERMVILVGGKEKKRKRRKRRLRQKDAVLPTGGERTMKKNTGSEPPMKEKRETKRTKQHEKQLGRVVVLLERRFERIRRKVLERAKKKRKEIRTAEQINPMVALPTRQEKQRQTETVTGFSFAWALWLLLLPRRKDGARGVQEPKQAEKTKQQTLSTKEPTQWVLLSIIWYLAMIRESRVAGSRSARQGMKQQAYIKRTKKKKSVMRHFRYPTIPNRGVIFALGS